MILVTGANGFVGRALITRLSIEDHAVPVLAAVRRLDEIYPNNVKPILIGDLSSSTNWYSALSGVQAIVHCAARVHVMRDTAINPLTNYRQVNVEGTINLAEQAAKAGVRRFVFVSSIKVNGETTELGKPFFADDTPAPVDPYGISKMEAEQGLREISYKTGMELVIVRPPLVYGAGVKANFATMVRTLSNRIPLPFGSINNARSMVALDNLIDLLAICLKHPAAVGQTFLVSDGEDISTTELLQRTARIMDKTALLLPVPITILNFASKLFGKNDLILRLCNSLQVDMEKTKSLLDWQPPLTLDQGLQKAIRGVVL